MTIDFSSRQTTISQEAERIRFMKIRSSFVHGFHFLSLVPLWMYAPWYWAVIATIPLLYYVMVAFVVVAITVLAGLSRP